MYKWSLYGEVFIVAIKDRFTFCPPLYNIHTAVGALTEFGYRYHSLLSILAVKRYFSVTSF